MLLSVLSFIGNVLNVTQSIFDIPFCLLRIPASKLHNKIFFAKTVSFTTLYNIHLILTAYSITEKEAAGMSRRTIMQTAIYIPGRLRRGSGSRSEFVVKMRIKKPV